MKTKKKVATKGRKTASRPFVICRCTGAGVHAGFLVSRDGEEATLTSSRRLWRWTVPQGKPEFLSGVAVHGLGDQCQIGTRIDVTLTGVCEVITCTETAKESILGYQEQNRSK